MSTGCFTNGEIHVLSNSREILNRTETNVDTVVKWGENHGFGIAAARSP